MKLFYGFSGLDFGLGPVKEAQPLSPAEDQEFEETIPGTDPFDGEIVGVIALDIDLGQDME